MPGPSCGHNHEDPPWDNIRGARAPVAESEHLPGTSISALSAERRLRVARMMESGSGMRSAEYQLRWRPVLLSLELTQLQVMRILPSLTLGVAVSIARVVGCSE